MLSTDLSKVLKKVNAWGFENDGSGLSRNGPDTKWNHGLSIRSRPDTRDLVEHGSQSTEPLTQRTRNPHSQPQGCQTLTDNVRVKLRFQKRALLEPRLIEDQSKEAILVTEND